MRYYLKYIFIFLKAAAISLLFGVCWALTFYGLEQYTSTHMQTHRNDFFFDIVVFFFSGLVGALLFFISMFLFEKVYNHLREK
ncbi:hypothetical protein [Kordia antarctica]|nr:hypothetical protein [Kordia antarctica]